MGKEALVEGIKEFPKQLLKNLVGAACLPFGVLAGALYSATLVGPLIVGGENHSKNQQAPSLEESAFRGQMPVAGNLLMGSADLAADGVGLVGSVAKEMAAPITWGADSYKFGYNLIE